MVTRLRAKSKASSLLGQRLFAQRSADGLSQAELGTRFSVTPSTIGRWEQGGSVQRRHWEALAKYLGLTVDDLRQMAASPPAHHLSLVPATSPTEASSEKKEKDAARLAIQKSALRCLKRGPTREEAMLALGLLVASGQLSHDALRLMSRRDDDSEVPSPDRGQPPKQP